MMFDAEMIRRTVLELGFPPGSALVHAGAALTLHGLSPSAGDIDIAVNEIGWQHALSLGTPAPALLDDRIEPRPGVEVFNGWLGEPLSGLFARAVERSGILVASPADILEFKRKLNREKDQEHIRILESFLQ